MSNAMRLQARNRTSPQPLQRLGVPLPVSDRPSHVATNAANPKNRRASDATWSLADRRLHHSLERRRQG